MPAGIEISVRASGIIRQTNTAAGPRRSNHLSERWRCSSVMKTFFPQCRITARPTLLLTA